MKQSRSMNLDRSHNRELINKTNRLVEASFIVHMLYKHMYQSHISLQFYY